MLASLAVATVSAAEADFNKLKARNNTATTAVMAANSTINAGRAVSCYYSSSTFQNLADYYVVVSDTETAEYDQNMGSTSAINGWVISFDFANDYSPEMTLQTGTYTSVTDPYPEDPNAFNVITDYSVCRHYDTDGKVDVEAIVTGDVVVSCDAEGLYTITAKASDGSGNTYDINYTGRLPFTDPTTHYYILRQIMEDRENQTFKGGMGFYYGTSLQTSKGGEMMIQLYSDAYDEENGLQYDETSMICLDIVGRPFPNGELTIDPGTYPIKSYTTAVRGDAIAGRELTYMSQTICIGCYLRDRSSSKYSSSDPFAYAYIASGDIVIEKTDKGYKISLTNGVTTLGYKVSFEYEGPIGPLLDSSTDPPKSALSTIEDDVDLQLSDLPLARAYNSGAVNGNQTFIVDIGSRSGKDAQRIYGGDVIRMQFVNRAGTPALEPGEYSIMDEPYDTFYMPGKMAQSYWAALSGGGTDLSGTCYIHFEKDRYLVMDDYAWFKEGSVTVSLPTDVEQPEGYNNRIYTFDINLIADNSFYVTGKWTGPVELMYNPDGISAISAVATDGAQAKVICVSPGIYQISDYAGEVAVYNVSGTLCGTFEASSPIDLSDKAAGVYIFKMGKSSAKIVK